MPSSHRFQVNPQIVHETMQGEVVVINLESGCYYSLTGIAAELWTLLQDPLTLADMVGAVGARYAGAPGEIEAALSSFARSLESEGLVAVVESVGAVPKPEPSVDGATQRPVFVAPVLQKYSDMQDLLQIDPIHEVGEAGWPLRQGPKEE
jgi:hypothetical protein